MMMMEARKEREARVEMMMMVARREDTPALRKNVKRSVLSMDTLSRSLQCMEDMEVVMETDTVMDTEI
jgi:hypothetical protein